MPVYEYQCKACSREFEYQQRMADPDKTTCEACGGSLERLISRTAFQLKGSGWYKDLYSSQKPAAADGKAEGGDAAGSADKPAAAAGASADKPAAASDKPAAKSSDGGSSSGSSSSGGGGGGGGGSTSSGGGGSTSSGGGGSSASGAASHGPSRTGAPGSGS